MYMMVEKLSYGSEFRFVADDSDSQESIFCHDYCDLCLFLFLDAHQNVLL